MTTYQRACKFCLGRNPAEINEKKTIVVNQFSAQAGKDLFFHSEIGEGLVVLPYILKTRC